MRKKEKQMKEREEEEKNLIDKHLCLNAFISCHNNLIVEERENTEKEINESTRNLKSQVAQLQKVRINNHHR